MERIIVSIILFFVMTTSVLADKVSEMLAPSVTVYVGRSSGSGTVMSVDPIIGSYIMTNYHVIVGMKTEKTVLTVKFYGDTTKYPAYVFAYSEAEDIAIIVTTFRASTVATLGTDDDVNVFDEVYCIGASLGSPLAPSRGIITQKDFKMRMYQYKRILTRMDCGIAPGNSGGGLYVKHGDTYVYIGMPEIVFTAPIMGGLGRSAVPFLGASIRIQEIRAFLNKYNIEIRSVGTEIRSSNKVPKPIMRPH